MPVASGAPLQVAFFQIFAWVGSPAPTVPCTFGLLLLAGLAGSVAVMVGASGGVVACAPFTSTWLDVGVLVLSLVVSSARYWT